MNAKIAPLLNATFYLELSTAAPTFVGAGSNGSNIVDMWTHPVMVCDPEIGWVQHDVPGIPGRSLRGVLREIAMTRYMELVGLPDGAGRDALRLLFKGGKLDKSVGGVDLEMQAWLREHCPPLSLFGYMDNVGSSRGRLITGDVLVWCEELVNAGRLPHKVEIRGADAGDEPVLPRMESVDLFDVPGQTWAPIPLDFARHEETGYRRDLLAGEAQRFLPPAERAQIEQAGADLKAARAQGEKAGKRDRREANESMPHTVRCMPVGVPLLAKVQLEGVTEIEYACFALTLADWKAKGCPVGGKTRQGFGSLALHRAVGAKVEATPGTAQLHGTPVVGGLQPGEAEVNAYVTAIQSRADEIRDKLLGAS